METNRWLFTCNITSRINDPIKYEIPYNAICGLIPCTKYRTEYRYDIKKIVYLEEQTVPTCCQGYGENPARQCVPVCLDGCRNGRCVKPGICKCDPQPTETSPGFVGPTCSRYSCLDDNKWGTGCNKECNCPTNAFCHATTGKCICRANWRGPDCSESCDSASDCEEAVLLPVIEPDVNSIPDISVRADRLISIQRDMDSNESEALSTFAGFAFTQTSVNLLLVFLILMLVFTIVRYRRRVNALENQQVGNYYEPTSTSGSDRSYYTTGSSGLINRPRMPTPDEASLSKNLSFAAATRNIIKGNDAALMSSKKNVQAQLIVNPRIESHLIASHKDSESNVYSEVQSSLPYSSYSLQESLLSESDSLSINVNQSTDDYGHYQVPKSPSKVLPVTDTIESNPRASLPSLQPNSDLISSSDDNIYEEIKPTNRN